jgi:hypothetical protein
LRDNIMRTGGKLVFGYNYDGSIESFNLVTANMQKFGSVYGTYAQLDGSNQGNQFSGYTNLKLLTSDCFGHSVSLAFGSSAGGETSENAKTLITEAGLEGKLNLGGHGSGLRLASARDRFRAGSLLLHVALG